MLVLNRKEGQTVELSGRGTLTILVQQITGGRAVLVFIGGDGIEIVRGEIADRLRDDQPQQSAA